MKLATLIKLLYNRRKLNVRLRWSRQQLEVFQTAELRKLRDFAYKNSSYYQETHKGLYDRPLQYLPVITKTDLMNNYDRILTDKSVNLKQVEAFLANYDETKLLANKFYVVATSGSTGRRGMFIYNQTEWDTILASYARGNDWAHVRAGLLHPLKVAVVSSTTPWHQSALVGRTLKSYLVPTLRIDANDPLPSIVARLNEFKPRSLVGYAGMNRILAVEQIDGRLKINPQAVFCASEVLTNDSRALIRKAWGVEATNVYAATETASVASENWQHHQMALYEDLVIAEPVDDNYRPVKPGDYARKVLVTVLFSRTLPLIRYEMSDNIMLAPTDEHFGPFSLLGGIQGRIEDTLEFRKGNGEMVRIHPVFFDRVMEKSPVAAWQIVQTADNSLIAHIVRPSAQFKKEECIELFQQSFAAQGLDVEVAIEFVAALRKSKMGKTILISRAPPHGAQIHDNN